MSRDGCVALPCGAVGLSAVVIVVFPDHNNCYFWLGYSFLQEENTYVNFIL